ncbi:MAG: glycosyltransferase family 39 protein [Candidatus Marsarchaeota archaeon]|nr:glycosyltransferase family 39 protein [Candidatus Marsarchaeota archaeon]
MAKSKTSHAFQYSMLLVIVAFSVVISLVFLKGISVYGADVQYIGLVGPILSGSFRETSLIVTIRLMMLYPLSLSVLALGYNNIGAGAYEILCYVGAVVVAFFIGRKLYDYKVGLLSAFLFSIFPLAVTYSSAADTVMPLGFFLSLSLLFFIYAAKSKRSSRIMQYYTLSGAFAFVGALIDPLAFIYILAFALYIVGSAAMEISRREGVSIMPIFFVVGIVILVLIVAAINLYLAPGGRPFYEFIATAAFYSTSGGSNNILYTNYNPLFYVDSLFPYSFSVGALASQVRNIFAPSNILYVNENGVGLFGYFILAFCLYLLATRDKKSYFLLGFSGFVLLYMSIGTMSISHYFPIYKQTQYLIILILPLSILLARGMVLSVQKIKKRYKPHVKILAVAIIVVLFWSSLPIDYAMYIFNHNTMLFSMVIGKSLMHAPGLANATVYSPGIMANFIAYYMGFPKMKGFGAYNDGEGGVANLSACSAIPNDTYIIVPSQAALNVINDNSSWPISNPWYINEPWITNPSICNLTLYADIYNNATVRNLSTYGLAYTGNIYRKS